MDAIITFIHVVACLALIAIVLLQTGRGAEMGAAFGGASQTLFGSTGGTTFLKKLTTIAAVVFMLTCLALTYRSGRTTGHSIMDSSTEVQEPAGPSIPEAKPVQGVPGSGATAPPQATPAPGVAGSTSSATEQAAPTPDARQNAETPSAAPSSGAQGDISGSGAQK